MNYEVVTVKALKNEGTLYCYEHTESKEIPVGKRRAMLVLPGGGYAMCSDREGEPLAAEFFNRGYNAYVLYYPCAPARYPVQLAIAATAIDVIRKRAENNATDINKVFAMGFSAGGHLCASVANCPDGLEAVKGLNFRPDGIVLGYPVIREKPGHVSSYENLLGDKRGKDTAWLDLHTSVRDDNPPAFIWATADDQVVPVISSLSYAAAYNEKNLKYELHIFSHGPHGMSLADERVSPQWEESRNADVAKWVDFADKFLRSI